MIVLTSTRVPFPLTLRHGLNSPGSCLNQSGIRFFGASIASRAVQSQALVVRLKTLQEQYLPAVSEFLNAATGYDAVVERKQRVEKKDLELKDAMRSLDQAKLKYEESIDDRRRCQKEINSLLQRKDSWGTALKTVIAHDIAKLTIFQLVNEDIHRFTDLYRKDLTLEATETSTKQAYKQASDQYEIIHQEYLNQIRERYIDEQLFSDKIRSASTWWTVGLISAHLAIFLMVSIRDPWVKKRDRTELVALVQDVLQKENAALQSSITETLAESSVPTRGSDSVAVLNDITTLETITRDPVSLLAGIGIGCSINKSTEKLKPFSTMGGGLQRRKPAPLSLEHEFKVPEPKAKAKSLLGLDALAVEKRRERERNSEMEKKDKRSFVAVDVDLDLDSDGVVTTAKGLDRRVRRREDDTPGIGLNSKGRDRERDRDRDRRGLTSSNRDYASSSSTATSNTRDYSRNRDYSRDRDRDRDRDDSRNSYERPATDRSAASTGVRSSWDIQTPRVHSGSAESYLDAFETADWASTSSNAVPLGNGGAKDAVDDKDWEAEQQRLDREWYNHEEGGSYEDSFANDSYNEFDAYYKKKEEELAQHQVVRTYRFNVYDDRFKCVMQKKLTARQVQFNRDNDLWETNRMLTSGVVQRMDHSGDAEEDQESRVHILVRDLKPPFLDGKIVFTKQIETVQSVKDPTSDLAVFARAGSKLVRDRREQEERRKAAPKFQLEGTNLGNIMGIKKDTSAEAAEGGKADDQDFKSDNQFSTHMKTKNDAVSTFATTKTMAEQRQFLPAFAVREELLQVIRDNQIVVVIGKTTQLTQYLNEDGYSKYGMIGCTQPRRVAAMSVAKRVSEEMGCKLGADVGYAIRFEDCTSDETVIKYMTDGVLLRECLNKSDLDQYSCIIMDEAHERSLNTDVLMGLLKNVIARRRDLKLIVTSATMNAEKFSTFFGNVPTFTIPGRTFPVDIMFSKTPCEDYVDSAVKQVLAIHLSHPPGDILVFMTGQEDIEITCSVVRERLSQLDEAPPLAVLPIYSQLPADLQAKIFARGEGGARKCIVATNVAETSLTVDGIMYVVDTGFSKLKVFNPKIGMDSLLITPISQANSMQRSGRAGRTGAGTCYRLYTEMAFRHEMYMNNIPEIQRISLSNVVLLLKSLGVKNLLEFDFMDPPPQDNILNSMYQLWVLGALDNTGELTDTGRKMVEFPLDPSLSKMLIVSTEMGCSAEILIIVSMLSVPSIFYRPKERAEESDAAREKFMVSESDHLTLLHVYTQWKINNYRDEWCGQHFIHAKGMRKAREVYTQLVDIMKTEKLTSISCGNNWDMGFTPDYIVYHELVMTSKEYMQFVTAVDPYWLAELGPMFFSVKEHGFTHKDKRRQDRKELEGMEQELRRATELQKLEENIVERAPTPRTRILTPGMGRGRRRDPGTPFRFGF
ncbi:UNVERIFIED_CONTAM: DEAH-box RNA helicase prp16 [Siphonaria sp. JEL0065]|nr:DEAH-box RNA helicase prp16 [Siphonaria sp. JEL0065]